MESPLYKSKPKGLKLIETIGFDTNAGFIRLGDHLDRAEHTAKLLGFSFDRAHILEKLGNSVGNEDLRIRLTLDDRGCVEIGSGKFTKSDAIWAISISKTPLSSDDPWLRIKTTKRDLYDFERANLPRGVDELIYLNEKKEVCEGTITNVFLQKNDQFLTPTLSSGLLPGILRAGLLLEGKFEEGKIYEKDLQNADKIWVGNSLRGLIPARLKI